MSPTFPTWVTLCPSSETVPGRCRPSTVTTTAPLIRTDPPSHPQVSPAKRRTAPRGQQQGLCDHRDRSSPSSRQSPPAHSAGHQARRRRSQMTESPKPSRFGLGHPDPPLGTAKIGTAFAPAQRLMRRTSSALANRVPMTNPPRLNMILGPSRLPGGQIQCISGRPPHHPIGQRPANAI
jgi:hypothetical protein